MKAVTIAVTMGLLGATPLFAQSRTVPEPRGYVSGFGGFATSVSNTTGDVLLEGGMRIAPHVMLIGNVGRFGNLQGDLQPTLDATTASLTANQGLTALGGGTLPAWHTEGGLRLDIPMHMRISPYVLGTLGAAHLEPSPKFTFENGTLPDGSTPAVGSDITSAITSAGSFTAPAATTSFMFTMGGGVQVPLTSHWAADAGYRYSRIAADSTLSASPLNVNGMAFGLGYRF